MNVKVKFTTTLDSLTLFKCCSETILERFPNSFISFEFIAGERNQIYIKISFYVN